MTEAGIPGKDTIVQEGMRLSLSGREGKSLQDAESIVEKRKSWYTYIHRQGKRERALKIIVGHVQDDKPISSIRSFVYDMLGPTPDRGNLLYRYEHSLRAAKTRPSLQKQKAFQKTT